MAEVSLKEGPEGTAYAQVCALAVWQKLEALDALANHPAKVREWSERFWLELQECRAT